MAGEIKMRTNYLKYEDIIDNVVIIKINQLYYEGMSDLALYETTRGYWRRTIQSLENYNYALAVVHKKVIEVYKIDKWQKSGIIPMKTRKTKTVDHRVGFVGKVADENIRSRYINKDVSKLYKQGESSPIKTISAYQNNIKNVNKNSIFENMIEDELLKQELSSVKKLATDFNYIHTIKKRSKPIVRNGVRVYKRERQVSINALNHAHYKCEYDFLHFCFLKKDGKTPYTEAHHLIPMEYQDNFENSIDIEENAVSLCSHCHNEIHYGMNSKTIITKLYNERKDLLEKKGIIITLEKLLSFYHIY